jgi:hypothetical protein
MCVTKVWGVLGGKPWFYTFWGFWGLFWGWVRLASGKRRDKNFITEQRNIIINQRDINIILYIYIYTGGGYYRGYMGYRPFIDSPLDSIDIYIYDR